MRPWYPFLILILVAGIWIYMRQGPSPAETLEVGRPLPEVMVTPLGGGDPRPLSEEVVGVTVVNIFASWCAPCRAEHPALVELNRDGVRLVGLSYRDEPADTQAFLDELGDPFVRVVADPQAQTDAPLGLGGAIPQTFVVASDGEVLFRHSGPLVGTDGEAALARIRELAGPR
ncbi:redoxin family protein [Brevundimonas sp.]|uniref:redoxin family protein n=1 Tax=Brevundimonas sp. TaxID=1871086 RepID=UPI0025D09315|nr:redoxin family protein [Brevundimonas sp.]